MGLKESKSEINYHIPLDMIEITNDKFPDFKAFVGFYATNEELMKMDLMDLWKKEGQRFLNNTQVKKSD